MDAHSRINTLVIDINEQTSSTRQFDAEILGGVDLGLHLLNELRANDTHAVVLATGRFAGTTAPSSGMVGAFTAPDGEPVEDYFPGSFGPQMVRSGLDAIAFLGTAERPTYVIVDDGTSTFHRAEMLVKQPLPLATGRLLELVGDPAAGVLVTGPAADLGLAGAQLYGGVMGRGNFGEVLARKRLKAVAVRGSGDIRVPDAVKLLKSVGDIKVKGTKLPEKFKKESNGMRACLQCRHHCRASFNIDGSVYSFTFRELSAFSQDSKEILKTLKICYDGGVNPLACAKQLGAEKSPSKKLGKLLDEEGITQNIPQPQDGTRLFDALLTCRLLPIGEDELIKLYPAVTGNKLSKTAVQKFEKRIEKVSGELAKSKTSNGKQG